MCNRQKKGCRVARGEQQLFHAGYALERVHIDIMGPLVETQKGNKYILVIVDQFTKWVEAFPLKNKLAKTVAGVVVREFVARFGCPLEIHTDQGRNFESELFKEMDGEAGWWTTSGNIGLPPLARVMGVGRQQQLG